jgi:hypothetical protein
MGCGIKTHWPGEVLHMYTNKHIVTHCLKKKMTERLDIDIGLEDSPQNNDFRTINQKTWVLDTLFAF